MFYTRVLLKLSGEALACPPGFGLDTDTLSYLAEEVAKAHGGGPIELKAYTYLAVGM